MKDKDSSQKGACCQWCSKDSDVAMNKCAKCSCHSLTKADDYLKSLHECRLLVFLESDDHKNFYPVLLNAEQFKKVSDAIIAEIIPNADMKPDYEMTRTNLCSQAFRAELFDGLQSITPQEQLDAIEDDEPDSEV